MEGYRFRSVRAEDLDDLYALVLDADPGLTHLPRDRNLVTQLIQQSMAAFANPTLSPIDAFYFFVLENLQTGQVVGCSGIDANQQATQENRYFRVIDSGQDLRIRLEKNKEPASQLAALFLWKREGVRGLGEFLSRARFLWMAREPHRFYPQIIAEIRGRTNKIDYSPFWEAIGKKITGLSFEQASNYAKSGQKAYLMDLLEHTDIPVNTLDRKAKACLGLPHKNARRAIQILLKENFTYSKQMDIIDAGPLLYAGTETIPSIASCQTLPYAGSSAAAGPVCLVGFGSPEYKVVKTSIQIEEGRCLLPANAAKHLGLMLGDSVQVLRL